jgi:UDP-glucose 4-epimerase
VRALVTGGLGYLGHAVTVELLAAGHQVTVLTRGRTDAKPVAGADLIEGDIRDRERVRAVVAAGNFDAACHLAALTHGRDSLADPLNYYDVNVGGTLNLLMALARGARLVLASTNVAYGSRNLGALREDMDPHPESPYAASKLAAEQLVAAHAATGAIGATSLRFFNLAGAVGGVGDTDPTRIIPNTFRAVTGELPHVTMNGDGSAVRDFVHVADAATAMRLALETARPGEYRLYNVGSGVGASMAEIVAAVEAVMGRPVKVERTASKPEPHTLIADTGRVRRELGWVPTRSTLPQILSSAWGAWPGR